MCQVVLEGEVNQGGQVSRLHVWLIVVSPTDSEYRRKSKSRIFKGSILDTLSFTYILGQ